MDGGSESATRGRQVDLASRVSLGATLDGDGVAFALFSQHAEAVELCLFDRDDATREIARVALVRGADDVWRTRVAGLGVGARYGYRVHGPYAPADGHRFNPAKLLIDPYARALTPLATWDDRLLGYRAGAPGDDLARDDRDDADVAPRAIVVDPSFDWDDDRPPRIPWERTLIYEMHVKGLTARHPGVSAALRGTYAGLHAPAVLEHLVALGVTAVELLPVHHAVAERHLAAHGLTNYWGYNTLGFFAPDARFATRTGCARQGDGAQVREFQTMVRALHRVGIEVILDVVYNHTAEGDRFGPTLAFRGIDNRVYYRLDPADPRTYVNLTGTGNTLDVRQPRVLALVVDSLRYWVETMHVDGFRFDLASALARDGGGFDPHASLLAAIRADPVLAPVKLIAEPWDATSDGYALGRYPPPWREWNDRYRDDVRRWWRGERGRIGAFAARLCGSPELYAPNGRGPTASVNFVTAHDGFSLRDLVSYDRKHNEANREQNRDGADDNVSWNCGIEGATDDAAVNALRARQQRNFLATLLVSQGVPMLRAGDELGATQHGNNNAYCQDNALTWLDWDLDADRAALLAFTRRLLALVRRHPGLRPADYFAGALVAVEPGGDLVWYAPSGGAMREPDWHDPERRVLGMWLRVAADAPHVPGAATAQAAAGDADAARADRAPRSLLVLLNASPDAALFALPTDAPPGGWTPLLDTARPDAPPRAVAGGAYELAARSVAILTLRAPNGR